MLSYYVFQNSEMSYFGALIVGGKTGLKLKRKFSDK